MTKKAKKSATERLIHSARLKIRHRNNKLRRMIRTHEEETNKLKTEIADEREILKALGATHE